MNILALGLSVLQLGQVPEARPDTLRLPALHSLAVEHDPRAQQFPLHAAQTGRRLSNLSAGRLPRLRLRTDAAYQSEGPSLPVHLPGVAPPRPPKERYEAALHGDQVVYDAGRAESARALERGHLALRDARLRVALYTVREEVDEAFFTALLMEAREVEIATLVADLEARLALVATRVREGAALPGEAAVVQAEILRARQQRDEVVSARRAALDVLGRLIGRRIDDSDVLAFPDLSSRVEQARRAWERGELRSRPEYAALEAEMLALRLEERAREAEKGPELHVFGLAGYGRPGFDPFRRELGAFWQLGVRMEWVPWDWGRSRRDTEILRIQAQIVETERKALSDRLARQVEDDLYAIRRLSEALEGDDAVVALREQIEREARLRADEGVIPSADYVEARNDVLEARLTRRRHELELARAQVRFLTTLGEAP